jgi:hypothetical protein
MLAIIQSKILCPPVLYQKNLKIKIYKTLILPIVLYGCETWSLIWGRNIDWGFLRTVCWRYLGLKGRKMDHGENCIMMSFMTCILHWILLGWLNQGVCDGLDLWHAWGGEGRGAYRVLVGRPEGKRPLGIPRRRWEYNIKMDVREIGIDGANWIRLSQDRVHWRAFVNTVVNLRVP